MNTLSTAIPTLRGVAIPMQNLHELQALDGLKKLDSEMIGAIYDEYFPEVYRYVRYRLSDEQAAEDIASDVFLRLLEASQRKRGPQTNLRAWLLATASHAVIDHFRQAYRRPAEPLPEDLRDPDPGPHDMVDLREQQRSVQQAYARLTAEQQHVLALRFSQGYSLEETAAALAKNVNAVKALQFRALAALQRNIEEMNDDRSVV
ncbi:MAG TPA: sigma-70 family RNA polymerase sigma factor [Anaerolineales bacterium]|nr:sigma-70 family RNA polymerase sigma factor [Anaerolineales bacterium]